MVKNTTKPFINVKEKGRNFQMINCEFQMGDSERPILETKAENTKIEGTKVMTTPHGSNLNSWSNVIWKFLVPLIVTITAGVLLRLLLGS